MKSRQLLLLVTFLFGSFLTITAQNCAFLAIESAEVDSSQQVCLDVYLSSVETIGSFQGSLSWTAAFMEYVEINTIHPLIEETFIFNDVTEIANGKISFGWYSLEGIDSPNQLKLFTLCLDAVGSDGSATTIDINSDFIPFEIFTAELVSLDHCILPGMVNITENPSSNNDPALYGFVQQIDCETSATASISTSVFFGTPPYTFNWIGANGFSAVTQNINNLIPGTYSVTVTDFNGNNDAESFVINPSSGTISTSAAIQGVSCFQGTDGSIDLLVSPSSDYTFSWSNGATTEDIENLEIGDYQVTVASAGGCSTMATFEVDHHFQQLSSVAINSISCANVNDGSIQIELVSTEPATYAWSNGATTQNIDNLAAGSYTVTINDAAGCLGYYDFEIEVIPTPMAEISSIECASLGMDNGRANITVTPDGNYKYNWSDNFVGISGSREDLAAGIYTVTINSTSGCEYAVLDIGIFEGVEAYEAMYYSCGADTLDFSVSTSDFIVTYDWSPAMYFNDPTIADPLFFPPTLEPDSIIGVNLEISAIGGCTSSINLLVQGADNCVWPGDTNDDSSVNSLDFLYIGLVNGNTGPARSPQSSDWFAQPATPWGVNIPGLGIDAIHADCDGNGIVEQADADVIMSNLGLTHYNFHPDIVENRATDIPLTIKLVDDLQPNQLYNFDIELGESTEAVDAAYGIAFQIKYDPTMVNPDFSAVIADGWLAASNDVWTFDIDNSMAGILDVAMTKSNGISAMGFGKIGSLTLQFNAFDQDQEVHLEIMNPYFLNHLGEVLAVIGRTTTTTLKGMLSDIENPAAWKATTIFPNPTKDFIQVKTDQQIQHYSLCDLQGSPILSGREGFEMINIKGLASGVYALRLMSTEGNKVFRVVVTE